MNGTSIENDTEYFEDLERIEAEAVIEWEMHVAVLTRTDESDNQIDELDADKPSDD
jgi:hypothetical protein